MSAFKVKENEVDLSINYRQNQNIINIKKWVKKKIIKFDKEMIDKTKTWTRKQM